MTIAPRTVITGGTRGIGAAVARRLAAEGHDVVALGRSGGHAPPAPGVRVDAADVTDPTAMAAAMRRANADGAGITGLVVSAGIWEPTPVTGDVTETSPRFRRVLDVNLLGTVHSVGALLPHARKDADISIVLVGSTAGQRGEAGYAAYAASKAALTGLCKSWAVELAPLRVRVNVLAPGWVYTDMSERTLGNPAERARIEAATPRGAIASADDMAGPVAFLLSADSRHVTGTVISANGGNVLASY